MNDIVRREARIGALSGIGAYLIWGLLPLFLRLLHGVPALQILAHRVIWSLILLLGIVTLMRRWPAIRAVVADRRTMRLLLLSATLVALNWLIYIWAVLNGHVLEASLGYFINPLMSVALGMALLGERLRPAQGLAVALAAAGVLLLALNGGGALWISLSLAASFAFYGLVRKVAQVDALGGLLIETILLGPLALGWLLWEASQGNGAFGVECGLDLLLMLAGVVTAVPLLMFAAAARRLPLSTVGLLQYIAPTLQFLCAIFVFGEHMSRVHALTFACIWAGLAVFAMDGLRASRPQGKATAAR
ncbi:protein RarD [Sphingomonas oleivorans]|uniref:Protein RarD n=1 Tax=Sphingomonas oleivorans TaxID=1735121 RepID=A0A2T5G118_9SPHN|nr:EamA family transporter RarD [Sphingomonas oleivorans]PTQ12811.1 protein RarD [Sphingomonas oleivorans]